MAQSKRKFRTEVSKLLQIIVHSLYSHKEIFLRELISNAGDAIDKMRYEALNNPDLAEGDTEWGITITADKENRTLTISDNGIGMSRDEIAENLGTIARSGTTEFLEKLREQDVKEHPELIGQFGVGFYSAFMVADEVTVISRPPQQPAVKWRSKGDESYTIEDTEKDRRGTDVILHLNEGEEEFLEDHRLKALIKKFSDFMEHPIELEGETVNSRKALWLRSKSDIGDEEYHEFYKSIAHDFEDPLETIHTIAEGALEFRAVLFIPSRRPYDLFHAEPKSNLHLYIQRVFITDECEELLPSYLRFIKGVVDASDLPLNVSREMLQHVPALNKIRNNLVGRVLKTLKEMKEKDFDRYRRFHDSFGAVLKEGLAQDFSNREKIAELLLFESTATDPGDVTTLDAYLDGMPSDQEEIYYLAGSSREMLEHSPHIEPLKARSREVLFMTDPVDEFVMPSVEYKGKKLVAVNRDEVEETEEEKQSRESKEKDYAGLVDLFNEELDAVKEVRVSSRLRESACCLTLDRESMTPQMELLMKQMGQEPPESKRIFELNPDHPAVRSLRKLHETEGASDRVKDGLHLLYEEALLAEGLKPSDPAEFGKRINRMIEHLGAQGGE
ncbi:molecular chaperone HtpG [Kiritimatiella glycovorans]|uniref:Chaperone protein HtpG n=1 Tax=Kiritimatiella glycovorans TaxID=1307763 RepID=A0A0G3EGY8_9BACT|nr:molecular chaperone HtpG [Kiritimatiella glycovorans]AKJ64687.1 High temperature protein G [Kiritimatiella glycovorans]